MSNGTIPIGILQVSLRWIWRAIAAPMRFWVGIPGLEARLAKVEAHISDIFHIIVSDLSSRWTSEQRERVQRAIARFTLVNDGLGRTPSSGNPITREEINKLKKYTQQAERGDRFTPEEAREFRDLAEKMVQEQPREEWVVELLKVALFIFGLYALGDILKPTQPG